MPALRNPKVVGSILAGVDRFSRCEKRRHSCHTIMWHKNPEGPELAKNGHQHDCQVADLVAKTDTDLALSPRFRQVPIESPL
ncbi:hypothetical protein TNCV_627721 [Trichonephila clavipes]|nr:hypothetical protein TNCV_627721 [Trichonephila clavipes]